MVVLIYNFTAVEVVDKICEISEFQWNFYYHVLQKGHIYLMGIKNTTFLKIEKVVEFEVKFAKSDFQFRSCFDRRLIKISWETEIYDNSLSFLKGNKIYTTLGI